MKYLPLKYKYLNSHMRSLTDRIRKHTQLVTLHTTAGTAVPFTHSFIQRGL